MRKPSTFFVWTCSILLFLSLAFAACGGRSGPFTNTQAAQASSYHANYPGGGRTRIRAKIAHNTVAPLLKTIQILLR